MFQTRREELEVVVGSMESEEVAVHTASELGDHFLDLLWIEVLEIRLIAIQVTT